MTTPLPDKLSAMVATADDCDGYVRAYRNNAHAAGTLSPLRWAELYATIADLSRRLAALESPELSRHGRPQPPAHAAQGDEPRVGDVWRFTDSGREFDYAVVGQRHYSDDGATVWLGQERRLDGTLGEEADITLRDPAFPDEQRKWSLVSRAPAEPQPVQDRAQAAPGWWVKPGAARRDLWAFGTDGFPRPACATRTSKRSRPRIGIASTPAKRPRLRACSPTTSSPQQKT